MKTRWMLALAAALAVPANGSAQQYTLTGSRGIAPEDYRKYETGMISGFASDFENGVMVRRGGYGQTFTVDEGSTLLSYALFHEHCQGYPGGVSFTGTCLFRSYLAGFDAASGRVTDVLWESGVYASGSESRPWPFRPGVWLDPGKYVAFVLWEGTPPQPGYTGSAVERFSELFPIGSQPPASPGSEQVMLASRDPRVPVGQTDWTAIPTHDVQGFYATLDATVTPEPATLALLGTGLAGLLGAARRKRRRETPAE